MKTVLRLVMSPFRSINDYLPLGRLRSTLHPQVSSQTAINAEREQYFTICKNYKLAFETQSSKIFLQKKHQHFSCLQRTFARLEFGTFIIFLFLHAHSFNRPRLSPLKSPPPHLTGIFSLHYTLYMAHLQLQQRC